MHGLWLPPCLALSDTCHLSTTPGCAEIRQSGVVGHSLILRDGEVTRHQGIRISTPARTWLDLARDLPLNHLVAIGIQLVRYPWAAYESRGTPWSTPVALLGMLALHPNLQVRIDRVAA